MFTRFVDIVSFLRKNIYVIFILLLALSVFINFFIKPTWSLEKIVYNVDKNSDNVFYYKYRGNVKLISEDIPKKQDVLTKEKLDLYNSRKEEPKVKKISILSTDHEGKYSYIEFIAKKHYGFYSFLPAISAILLACITKKPLPAIITGIAVGSFMIGKFDIINDVIIPQWATKSIATMIMLYLFLLGGFIGILQKTGSDVQFAKFISKRFIKGPISAKVVTWCLGILFFQGGSTVSIILTGTISRPYIKKENLAPEEISYIIDSTSSPTCVLIPINPWLLYIQSFIYIPGVYFLATETDRILFFIKSIPLFFYPLFAVFFTFLISINKLPKFIMGKSLLFARERASNATNNFYRDNGDIDFQKKGYKPHIIDFILPVSILISISVVTMLLINKPQILWGFLGALVSICILAIRRGMNISDLVSGFQNGMYSVIPGLAILLATMVLGPVCAEVGGGIFIVDLLSESISYHYLPIIIMLLTMVISFSTGSAWGTYALAFPLFIPLCWSIAVGQDLENSFFFMQICFATIISGTLYGDQCSLISDTTILSSLVSKCNVVDHFQTQLRSATIAAVISMKLWVILTYFV